MKKKGFTLIELLVVIAIIAILAGIVIIAVNPARQMAQARNAQRRADVLTLLNASHQFFIDNSKFPGENTLKDGKYRQLGTGTGCNSPCVTWTLENDCLDLGSVITPILVPTYITAMPKDPKDGTPEKTLYAIHAELSTGPIPQITRLELKACNAELDAIIEVKR